MAAFDGSCWRTLIRCSRHRWTLLKLPPRRIERRLSAASVWFAELLATTLDGHHRSAIHQRSAEPGPSVSAHAGPDEKPSVVYFHANQLPRRQRENKLDLVNLNTAMAASEIWF